MLKKFFLLCLAMFLVMQGAASAKKNSGLPEEERVKIAIEIKDSSRHTELGTAQTLEIFLNDKLVEKNLVSVVDFDKEKKPDDGLILDEDRPAEEKSPAENIGELLVFDAIELPQNSAVPEDFNQIFYKNLGVNYVVHCEVLALGTTKVEDRVFNTIVNGTAGGLSIAGMSSGHRSKTLARVGTGVGLLGVIDMRRTALNTVVNMKFINVETSEIVWEKNFTGQALKHRKPDKDYDDVWTQAYMESVEDAAKRISKHVNKYVDKVLIQGKSDKEFAPKKSSAIGGGKLF